MHDGAYSIEYGLSLAKICLAFVLIYSCQSQTEPRLNEQLEGKPVITLPVQREICDNQIP